MEMPHTGIFVSECLGYMRGEDVRAFAHYGQAIIDNNGSLHGFHDWTAVMGYTNEARLVTTEWSVRNMRRLTEIHIALSSAMVRMAVAVANIGLRGKITIHDVIDRVPMTLGRKPETQRSVLPSKPDSARRQKPKAFVIERVPAKPVPPPR